MAANVNVSNIRVIEVRYTHVFLPNLGFSSLFPIAQVQKP